MLVNLVGILEVPHNKVERFHSGSKKIERKLIFFAFGLSTVPGTFPLAEPCSQGSIQVKKFSIFG